MNAEDCVTWWCCHNCNGMCTCDEEGYPWGCSDYEEEIEYDDDEEE